MSEQINPQLENIINSQSTFDSINQAAFSEIDSIIDGRNLNNGDDYDGRYESYDSLFRRQADRDANLASEHGDSAIASASASTSTSSYSQETNKILFKQQVNLIICVFLIVLSTLGVICSLFIITAWLHRKIKKGKSIRLLSNCIIPIGCIIIYIGCITLILTSLNCDVCWIWSVWLTLSGFNLIFGKLIYDGYKLRDLLKEASFVIKEEARQLKNASLQVKDSTHLKNSSTRKQNSTKNKRQTQTQATSKLIQNPYDENLNLITHHNKLLINQQNQHISSVTSIGSSTLEDEKDRHRKEKEQWGRFNESSSSLTENININNNLNQTKSETMALAVDSDNSSSESSESDIEEERRRASRNRATFRTSYMNYTGAAQNSVQNYRIKHFFNNHKSILLIIILLIIYDNLVLLIWTINYDVIEKSIENSKISKMQAASKEILNVKQDGDSNNHPDHNALIFNWISLWPLLLISSKLLYLLILINISWKLRRLLPKLSSPTNNVILACTILASSMLISPIIEKREEWPKLFLISISLLVLLHTTACLLLTQIPKLRKASNNVARSDSQLILKELELLNQSSLENEQQQHTQQKITKQNENNNAINKTQLTTLIENENSEINNNNSPEKENHIQKRQSRFSDEAVNLITKLTKQIEDQGHLIQALNNTTLSKLKSQNATRGATPTKKANNNSNTNHTSKKTENANATRNLEWSRYTTGRSWIDVRKNRT